MIFSDIKVGDVVVHPEGEFVVTTGASEIDSVSGLIQITGLLSGVDAVWLAESNLSISLSTETE